MLLALLLLGIPAGVLTMVAGQGGGLALILACSALWGPHVALALTTPAVLLGNVHRVVLFRTHVSRAVVRRLGVGAFPGAVAGALAAGLLPSAVLELVLVALTLFAIARALRLVPAFPARALFPAGLALGVLTGTSGGGGVVLSPVLLASGLSGPAFVGTSAAVAVLAHTGRLVVFGADGLGAPGMASAAVVLSVALFAGNLLGDRLRRRISVRRGAMIELGVLVVSAGLSVARLR